MQEFFGTYKSLITKLVIAIGVLLAVFLLVASVAKMKESRYIGTGLEATNTITVTGQGKVEKNPDTAKVSFSIRSEDKSVKTAQNTVSTKVDAISKELQNAGIDEKYIKTDSYTSYPQYEYKSAVCSVNGCGAQNATIRGYEVAHTITVSIKNLDMVDAVLGILAKNQVSDMQGPNFGFEDDKEVAREARDMAIEDAREEAKKLARALGVELVRVVSFNEQGNGAPQPMYERAQSVSAGAAKDMVAPVLPVGSQNINSTVTVVYEIK